MSSVQIYHRNDNGEENHIANIDGDLIKRHSPTVRNLIVTRSPATVYKITLSGPTSEALKFVVDEIERAHNNKMEDTLSITLGYRGISQSVRIHRAILCMKLQPEQPRVAAHIKGYLAHNRVTATEMLAVYDAYANVGNPHGNILNTMVNTIAWKFVEGELSAEQINQLKAASMLRPHLDGLLTVKVKELEEAKRVREIIAKKRAVKKAKRAAAAAAKEVADHGW